MIPPEKLHWIYKLTRMLFCCMLSTFLPEAAAEELIITRTLQDNVRILYGERASRRVKAWQELISTSRELPVAEQLEVVNNFFNQLKFEDDIDHWGKEDFWATPIEFLASGGGDCEDFAVAKYYTLRELGVEDKKLRITYVTALSINAAHMVLSYRPGRDQETLVLDNLDGEIKPASEREDLKPVYSFNGEGLWLSKQRQLQGKRLGKAERLTMWHKLRVRLQQSMEDSEGITIAHNARMMTL